MSHWSHWSHRSHSAAGTLCIALALLAASARAETNWAPRVRTMADFLLARQTPDGCIPDAPGDVRANCDSSMEYALLALAHAYHATGADRFRRALRDGIEWLANTMEKQERPWVGSWRFAYSAKAPYVPLPTSPGDGLEDARGVSSTSALFVYLVAVYTHLTKDTTLAHKVRPCTRAALEFLLERNRGPNGLFYGGWQREKGVTAWKLDRMQYAASQAEVYLGLRAGGWLLGHSQYRQAADKLARHVPQLLFDRQHRAFGVALDLEGRIVPPSETWEGYFPQGYLAWAFPPTDETRDALRWLRARQAPDNSFRRKKEDPPYILPAAAFCLGARRLGLYSNDCQQAQRWLRDVALTPEGGVRDFAQPGAPVHSRLAGWVAAAWLGAEPLPFGFEPRSPDY